jgi:hypothetical protein
MSTTAAPIRTFYKLDVQGIVYLIDPVTSIAYTYDLDDPVEIGRLQWTNPAEKPTLHLRPDWQEVMAAKMTAYRAAAAMASPDDATPTTDTEGSTSLATPAT